jgi:apoptosis-inducing factor 3
MLTEDAPAPMAIHSFQARVEDGKILVTADPANTEKKNMARSPKLLASGYQASNKPGVVIVGGGSGAFHAVESLREVYSNKLDK